MVSLISTRVVVLICLLGVSNLVQAEPDGALEAADHELRKRQFKEVNYDELVNILSTKSHEKDIAVLAYDSSKAVAENEFYKSTREMVGNNLDADHVKFIRVDLGKIEDVDAREYVEHSLFEAKIPAVRIIMKKNANTTRASLDPKIYDNISSLSNELKLDVKGRVKYLTVVELKKEMEEYPDATFVVVFYATWCGPCKMYDSVVKGFAKHPEVDGDIRVRKIDIDKEDPEAMVSVGFPQDSSLPLTSILRGGVVKVKESGLVTKNVIVDSVRGVLGVMGVR